ncbi:hypothetical protein NDU88_001811 [Pleurodeles waltl]|uniref:Uncharacterized protein n=1 Tax=Pleurodeles waltl TaxID=8319 RepID=A0AAV7UX54_PLEWA|nr:hypothetical protein NDU88_001811 [Pleurodeles waltl]
MRVPCAALKCLERTVTWGPRQIEERRGRRPSLVLGDSECVAPGSGTGAAGPRDRGLPAKKTAADERAARSTQEKRRRSRLDVPRPGEMNAMMPALKR